jgi:hypothetical protein
MTDGQDRSADGKLVGRKDISDYTGGWGIPAFIAAVIVIAGVLIFSAAGPERTRTAAYNNPNLKPAGSQPSAVGGAHGRRIPNPDRSTPPRVP